MNIRDLEYVVALADKKHFGLAAKACNVSQPALSHQIKKLEEGLGIVLFARGPQGVIPTEDAEFIIANARLILEKTAAIRQHANRIAKGERPKVITLGVIPTIAPYYLPGFFENLNDFQGHENIRWQLLEERTEFLLEKMDRGAIDAAILVVPATGVAHEHAQIFEEELFLAVNLGHKLAEKSEVSLGEIADDDWLLLDEGHCLNNPILEVCNKAGIGTDRHSFRATSLETLRHMVAHNTGVTLIPKMARATNDGIAYIRLRSPDPCRRAVSLVWRKNGLYAQTICEMAAFFAARPVV